MAWFIDVLSMVLLCDIWLAGVTLILLGNLRRKNASIGPASHLLASFTWTKSGFAAGAVPAFSYNLPAGLESCSLQDRDRQAHPATDFISSVFLFIH